MWHIFSYVFVFVFKHILSILSWWERKPKHVRIIVLWYCYFYSNYIILTFVVASCRGGEISMFFMWFLRFVCIVCVIIFWINVRERSLNLSFVCFICSSAKKGFKNKNGQYMIIFSLKLCCFPSYMLLLHLLFIYRLIPR